MFRKCAVFYGAIGAEQPPERFELDNIGKVTSQQIKRDLNPVLRKGERFDLKLVQQEVHMWFFLCCKNKRIFDADPEAVEGIIKIKRPSVKE